MLPTLFWFRQRRDVYLLVWHMFFTTKYYRSPYVDTKEQYAFYHLVVNKPMSFFNIADVQNKHSGNHVNMYWFQTFRFCFLCWFFSLEHFPESGMVRTSNLFLISKEGSDFTVHLIGLVTFSVNYLLCEDTFQLHSSTL